MNNSHAHSARIALANRLAGVQKWLRGDALALSDSHLSQTIGFARLTLIIGLVFLHYQAYPNSTASPFDGLDVTHHPVATFINSFVLFFFFSVVPLLSLISGWLFFALPAQDVPGALRNRIRKRFISLYLPLVFWNGLFVAALWTLHVLDPNYPLLHDPDVNLQFASASTWDYINAVFAVTQRPVGFQFWFVRDLFVTALISPILWLILRRAPYAGMIILGGAWLIGYNFEIFFRTDVVFFFYLGAFLRLRKARLEIGGRATLCLMTLYVALVALRALAPAAIDLSGPRPEWLTGATRAMRLIGVVACWGLFLHMAPTRLGRIVGSYGGLAFFLHSVHFPLLAEIKLLLWPWLPSETDGWMVVHYALSVIVTVALGLGWGWLLARHAPGLFALMNGGRALPVTRTAPVQVPSPSGSPPAAFP